jgi:hypothetical protein
MTTFALIGFLASDISNLVTSFLYFQAVTEVCNFTEDGLLVLKNGDEP